MKKSCQQQANSTTAHLPKHGNLPKLVGCSKRASIKEAETSGNSDGAAKSTTQVGKNYQLSPPKKKVTTVFHKSG